MNILFISPLSQASVGIIATGAEQRSQLILDNLQKFGCVYILLFSQNVQETPSKNIRFFKPIAPRNLFKKLLNVIGCYFWKHTGFCIMPVQLMPNVSSLFPDVKFDIVVCRYYHVLKFVKPWLIASKCYIDIDDHPLTLFDTMIASSQRYGAITGRFWRWILQWNLRYAGLHLEGTWVSNPDDLGRPGHGHKEALLSNIPMHSSTSHVPSTHNKALITIGSLFYSPNIEGIDNFVECIWPHVYEKHPEIEYWIIGVGASEINIKRWSRHDGVKYIGPVDDVKAYYAQALATVVPILSGGGTCIKTLESLANYRVCLSTPFGARGLLDAFQAEKKGVLIYRDADDFMLALNQLIADETNRNAMETEAFEYIQKNYSSRNFGAIVASMLDDSDSVYYHTL